MKIALVVLAVVLAGCDVATAPNTEPEQFRPEFRTADARGGGHGGSGGGGTAACSRPNASVECAIKAGGLAVTGGVIAGSCMASWTGAAAVACGGAINGFGWQARDYLNTPDCRSCDPGLGHPTVGPLMPWNDPNDETGWRDWAERQN